MATTLVAETTVRASDNDAVVRVNGIVEGNWLIAIVTWRAIDGSQPQINVGDLRGNLWTLLGGSNNVADDLHCQVWAAPCVTAAPYDWTLVIASALRIGASDLGSVNVNVVQMARGTDYLQLDSAPVVASAHAGTTLSITTPAPGASSLMIAVLASDDTTDTIAVTSPGWTALTVNTQTTAPTLRTNAMWMVSASAQTASWSSSPSSQNLAGLVVVLRESVPAPAVSSPLGVAVDVQLALGYDQNTPLSAMRWKTLTNRCNRIQTSRGITADLNDPESRQQLLGWNNDDGALTPREAWTATANAAGTTSTIKVPDAQAADVEDGDFVRLYTAAGVLKEDTVFEVLGTSSLAGTTTVTVAPAAAAATAAGDVVASCPVDIYTPARALVTVDGRTYPVMVSSAEKWPQRWLAPGVGRVDASFVDTYSTLSDEMDTLLHREITRARPYAYWSLDEAQGSAAAANLVAGSPANLLMRTSKFGAGSAVADFGASTQDVKVGAYVVPHSIEGDRGSGWEQTGLAAADGIRGYCLRADDDGFPSLAGGVSIHLVANILKPPYTPLTATILAMKTKAGIAVKVHMDNTGLIFVTTYDKDTKAGTVSASIGPFSDDIVTYVLTLTRTTWELRFNGVSQLSGSCDLAASWNELTVAGEADRWLHGSMCLGLFAHVAVFPRVLTPQEQFWLTRAQTRAHGGFYTLHAAMRRQINLSNWKGARIITTSDQTAAEWNGFEGQPLGEYLAAAARWDDGLLFVSRAGELVFRSRRYLDLQEVRWTIGDGAGEIPYLDAPDFAYDKALLFPVVNVDNTSKFDAYDGPIFAGDIDTSHRVTASLEADTDRYGRDPLTRPTYLSGAHTPYHLAWWLLARYGKPKLRVTQVQIDPRAAPGTTGWHMVLGVEQGDIVTVNRRPVGAPMISQRCMVIGIDHDATPGRWITTLTLVAAPDPVGVLDSGRTLGTVTLAC